MTVVMCWLAVHVIGAIAFVGMVRSSAVLVDEEGRPLRRERSVELIQRIESST